MTNIILSSFLITPLAVLNAAEPQPVANQPIDRQALVTRHNVELKQMERGSWLQVGNGEIAFGIDLTGLQTFAGNTLSHWGWHTNPLPAGQKPEDFKLEEWDTNGRKVGYATNRKGQEPLWNWLRENPHCMNLGKLCLLLDGKAVYVWQLTNVTQRLDLWSGVISSRYTLGGQMVTVETCAHPSRDMLAVSIASPLVAARRLSVEISFPYGDPGGSGANWGKPDAHTTTLKIGTSNSATFDRQLDNDRYHVALAWGETGKLRERKPHIFVLEPDKDTGVLEFACEFSAKPATAPVPAFAEVKAASVKHWPEFWNSGGAIDLSASKDPRWRELERRIVLSQYLLAVNEAGSLPPQEAGLYANGWNGKFHLEMHWWHGTHYALWNRWPLFDRCLHWYRDILPAARNLARNQGYKGARWPKMVGPNGMDSPSNCGPLIIWQQPHPIFYAELDYRLHPSKETLEKWRDVVFESAEFMADFVYLDAPTGKYILGPPFMTMPENNNSKATKNPTFELGYWRYGLRTAIEWRQRLGLASEAKWETVLNRLAPLPQAEGVYLQWEGAKTAWTTGGSHQGLIGAFGMLPGDGVDPAVMKSTVKRVMDLWNWKDCWGWDYPMIAMCAARTGQPSLAIDALMHPSGKAQYSSVGNNMGSGAAYFPGNGGLLYAVAMMAVGWDSGPDKHAPGFPDDGSWTVKWEGLKKAQ
ncbi:MAG: hypothetical protein WCP12_10770 [bacterium]